MKKSFVLTKSDKCDNTKNTKIKNLHIMRKFLKKEACAALSVFFEDDILNECKTQIEKTNRLRRYWDNWAETLKNNKEVEKYLTSYEEDELADITRQKRNAFRLLRLTKLRHVMPEVKTDAFRRYCEMLLVFYGQKMVATAQFLRIINKAEVKLVKTMSQEADIDEVRRFVLISALFSDKHYIYDEESKALYKTLCHRVGEANA